MGSPGSPECVYRKQKWESAADEDRRRTALQTKLWFPLLQDLLHRLWGHDRHWQYHCRRGPRLTAGGPGKVFWSDFSPDRHGYSFTRETSLSRSYRYRGADGTWVGPHGRYGARSGPPEYGVFVCSSLRYRIPGNGEAW